MRCDQWHLRLTYTCRRHCEYLRRLLPATHIIYFIRIIRWRSTPAWHANSALRNRPSWLVQIYKNVVPSCKLCWRQTADSRSQDTPENAPRAHVACDMRMMSLGTSCHFVWHDILELFSPDWSLFLRYPIACKMLTATFDQSTNLQVIAEYMLHWHVFYHIDMRIQGTQIIFFRVKSIERLLISFYFINVWYVFKWYFEEMLCKVKVNDTVRINAT
jgi:hypothetical protein